MTMSWSFSCNSFLKFHGKQNLETQNVKNDQDGKILKIDAHPTFPFSIIYIGNSQNFYSSLTMVRPEFIY